MNSLTFRDGDRQRSDGWAAPRIGLNAPADTSEASASSPSVTPAQSGGETGEKANVDSTARDVSDEQLLQQYIEGNRPAFTLLMRRYERELFHFLVRFLADRAAAEDVFQETFLQVHQSAAQFDLSRRFRPWLFTIAANKARDLIRSQSRRPTNALQAPVGDGEEAGEYIDLLQSAVDLPDQGLQQQELQTAVQKSVMELPDNLREILLLSYFHQFPYKQISDILEIPLGTVKSRLHAAVALFAERWRETNRVKFLS